MAAREISILVVDDEPVEARLLQEMLLADGRFAPEVVHVSNSKTVRQALSKQTFQIIFLDYLLGPENGLDVYKTIRAAGARCPVIFMTGHGSEALAAKAQRAGLTAYLIKQEMNPQTISQAVEQAVEDWEAEVARDEYEQILTNVATVDELTGLLNRRAFIPLLVQECARTKRYHRPLSFLAVDVENFTELTSTHGQGVAESILSSFSVLLRGVLRTTDHFCRYEGNRFTVILIETDSRLAEDAARRIIHHCRNHKVTVEGSGEYSVQAAIAACSIRPDSANADAVLLETFNALSTASQRDDGYIMVGA